MSYEIHHGDCLEIMPTLPDKSVDFILADVPYGTTGNAWDSIIPFETMWNELKRLVKPRGVIALFAQTPFDKALGMSNIDMLRYEWIWEKNNPTGFLNAKRAPMKKHENILVFYEDGKVNDDSSITPETVKYMISEKQKSELGYKQIIELLGNYMSSHYFTNGAQFRLPNEDDYIKLQSTGFWSKPYSELVEMYKNERDCNAVDGKYYPQGLVLQQRQMKKKNSTSSNYGVNERDYESEYINYPHSVLKYEVERGLHPTQKPVKLLEYLIKTYTLENETVLDFTMGSGSTGVAAINTNRDFIGIEMDDKNFSISEKRLAEAASNIQQTLF